MQVQWC